CATRSTAQKQNGNSRQEIMKNRLLGGIPNFVRRVSIINSASRESRSTHRTGRSLLCSTSRSLSFCAKRRIPDSCYLRTRQGNNQRCFGSLNMTEGGGYFSF